MRHYLPIIAILIVFFNLSFGQNSPCIQDTGYHIVVLGSSTAAGAGASPSDSSWVNRYRAYLQSFNPDYQVTNRAQGGFTTYRIMPTGFVPPAGRPATDTTKNITHALGLNPDAIIVNLPSNDVSSGYSVQEQLDNLDTIYTHAQNQNIPIWICTTQPKNYGGNQINIQKQLDVRDSIFSKYGNFAIDFWTGLADSSNQIAPAFDSGDGTHLNNSGHFLLFTRVAGTMIPDQLFTPSSFTDYAAGKLSLPNALPCGDPLTFVEGSFYNRGMEDSSDIPFSILVENLTTGQQITYSDTFPSGLGECEETDFVSQVNTSEAGTYAISLIIQSSTDGNSVNDTTTIYERFLGIPDLTPIGDTGCTETALELNVLTLPDDSIRWFDIPMGGSLLGTGSSFQTPILTTNATYYVEAARGDFVYKNQLPTTNNSNINWNGAMFDLVADTALIIDSLGIKIADLGNQMVEVYTKPGSHLGFETNPNAWTFLGAFPAQVDDIENRTTVDISDISLNNGDTLGVYVQLQNPGSRLSYQSLSQPITRSNDQLSIITGSGVSHNFAASFYPRDWNGVIYYHYGSKPDGDCLSNRVAVEAFIGNVEVHLGNDTILDITDSIQLDPGASFSSYLWSNGSMDSVLTLDGNQLGMGVYTVHLTVEDSLGCKDRDSIIVVFAPLVGLEDEINAQIKIWPNPVRQGGNLFFQFPKGEWGVSLYDLSGRMIAERKVDCLEECEDSLSIPSISRGIYQLVIRNSFGQKIGKLVEMK